MRELLSVSLILIFLSSTSWGKTYARVTSKKFAPVQIKKIAYYKRAETLSQSAVSYNPTEKEENFFSGLVNASYSRNLVDQKNGSLEASRAILAMMTTKLSPQWSLISRITLSEDLRNSESLDDGFSDAVFILNRTPLDLNHWLNGRPSFSAVLPVSERSTQVQNLNTSINAGYTFILNPEVLKKGFDLSLSLNGSRNFHAYETDKVGNVLNQYGLREILSSSYSFRKWTASVDLILRHGLSYGGNWTQAYEHSQEIAYSLHSNWSMTLGHTNSGSWLAPNGQDSNLKLINEDDSIFYLSTSVTF